MKGKCFKDAVHVHFILCHQRLMYLDLITGKNRLRLFQNKKKTQFYNRKRTPEELV